MKVMPTCRWSLMQLDLHVFAQLLVERRERLVQQQHLGLEDQRAGERHPLPLAARQRLRRPRAEALEADHGERLATAFAFSAADIGDRRSPKPTFCATLRCGKIA
jgi:hypothetical protein